MARIPTTEFCPQCAEETPAEVLAKSGRVQRRLFQDLDTGKFECEKGHVVELDLPVESPAAPATETGLTGDVRPPVVSQDDADRLAPAQQSAVAVDEMPQSAQSQIVPGSSRIRQGGSMEMTLVVPEQYVGPLQSYCDGIGKTVEEFVNEVVENGFSNGWFL